MNTVTVAELRQNPTPVLEAVEHGETFVVTRYRKEIARLVPPARRRRVTAAEAMSVYERAPLSDRSWSEEVARERAAELARDPWDRA
ncbi:type II toxin-antitoxin system Phd/YefM family antitoxin [Antribacter gilvus]|uniref:type II toxin-antitoxin system Phd/YefM family antitoxin n=1 Tax=Antribacter gilvus TaxID=2304675 RepID=UPI0019809808|nr:type II toxin-antitoxin system prevent-host-death family antitoxin [Antribacter gilvus]